VSADRATRSISSSWQVGMLVRVRSIGSVGSLCWAVAFTWSRLRATSSPTRADLQSRTVTAKPPAIDMQGISMAVHHMSQVNSHGGSRPSEKDFGPRHRVEVNSSPPEMAQFLRFCGPIGGRRDCPHRASRRRERSCQQTVSVFISMGCKLHKFRWMLPREF
jgi:hypothetical protein